MWSLGFNTHVEHVTPIQISVSVRCDMYSVVPLHRFDPWFGFYKSYPVALTFWTRLIDSTTISELDRCNYSYDSVATLEFQCDRGTPAVSSCSSGVLVLVPSSFVALVASPPMLSLYWIFSYALGWCTLNLPSMHWYRVEHQSLSSWRADNPRERTTMCSLVTVSPNIDCAVKLKILDQYFFSIIDSESDKAKQTLFCRRELITPFDRRGWA